MEPRSKYDVVGSFVWERRSSWGGGGEEEGPSRRIRMQSFPQIQNAVGLVVVIVTKRE